MKNLKNKLFIIFSLLCALALTSCMDLYDGSEVPIEATVTFHKNDGANNDEKYTQVIPIGKEGKLTKCRFTRDGFTFWGWSLTEEATSTSYVDEASVTLHNDLVLYARWLSSTSTITFDGNGGVTTNGATSYTQTMTTGITQALLPNSFKQTGKIFTGWALTDTATEIVYTDGANFPSSGNITLYAVWKDVQSTYNISYVMSDPAGTTYWKAGFTPPASYEVETDSESADYGKVKTPVSLPTIANINRTDKCFAGWYIKSTYEGNVWTEVSGTAQGDITFYAKWVNTGLYVAGTGHCVVTADGSDSYTGDDAGSEAHPFATLAKAVNTIEESPDNDWVIYIDGEVTGSTEIGTKKVKSLTIKGATGNNIDALNGNNSGSTISVAGKSNIIFEALTIKGGNGTSDASSNKLGGGIYINFAEAKVTLHTDSRVSSNTATLGGGVYASAGTLTISGGTVVNNTAQKGGGIYNAGATVTMDSGSIESNVAKYSSGNNKAGEGGGFYNDSGTFVFSGGSIKKNKSGEEIDSNTAALGGGIYNNSNVTISGGSIGEKLDDPSKDNCSNYANLNGGGIYNTGILNLNGSTDSFSVTGNYAFMGGGIYTTTTIKLNGVEVTGDSVTNVTGNAAGQNPDYKKQ